MMSGWIYRLQGQTKTLGLLATRQRKVEEADHPALQLPQWQIHYQKMNAVCSHFATLSCWLIWMQGKMKLWIASGAMDFLVVMPFGEPYCFLKLQRKSCARQHPAYVLEHTCFGSINENSTSVNVLAQPIKSLEGGPLVVVNDHKNAMMIFSRNKMDHEECYC